MRMPMVVTAVALAVVAPVRAAPEHLGTANVIPADMPFTAAVRAGDVMYLSGQMGTLPGTKTLVAGGIEPEARQAIANIRAILESNGRSLSDLIRCTVMLADIGDWATFNRIWMSDVPAPRPARSAFGTTGLALGGRVEVECTAAAN